MGALVSRLDNRNPGYDVDPTGHPLVAGLQLEAYRWREAAERRFHSAHASPPPRGPAQYRRLGVYRLLRNFPGLLMLPHEHVRSTFNAVCQDAANAHDERILQLTTDDDEWVVYMEPCSADQQRHRGLASAPEAEGQPSPPAAVPAGSAPEERSRLRDSPGAEVSVKKLKRYQRARYASVQGESAEGKRTTSSLLRACPLVYAPIPEQ
ncbi:hypothetical protein Bbelb_185650 [Branchiostoma belcheri]|nr:hypothetical protein Bbelb_185650 [Branchiostoma belcheri]